MGKNAKHNRQKLLYKAVPSDIDRIFLIAYASKYAVKKATENDAFELFLHTSQNITLACSIHLQWEIEHLIPQKARPHN